MPSLHELRCRRPGLVIAHPDDEAMFFGPTLKALGGASPSIVVHVLCLSTGNFCGLGKLRHQELLLSCSRFGISMDNVEVVNDAALQDGKDECWPAEAVARYVGSFVQRRSIDLLLTFDQHGVSGHPNHIAVCRGVTTLLHTCKARLPPVYVLQSVSLARKYIGVLDVLGTWQSRLHRCVSLDPRQIWCAMAAHRSQLVWFRRLFMLFSRYTYVNTYVLLQCHFFICDVLSG
ncbi:putative deacetylase LmbE-like domain-containing protein [Tribonema minus]|uniref:N-acetylglucosaminylphosphatidylinositol deacetylase n=1 Tax=Tribonema minus TaxID=303371 RepID=A0A836C9C4_9STRA|nr:putative deacetylase LmbE-like domain-containing protein [Tribonema minus]